jgi:hypothetical protein
MSFLKNKDLNLSVIEMSTLPTLPPSRICCARKEYLVYKDPKEIYESSIYKN